MKRKLLLSLMAMSLIVVNPCGVYAESEDTTAVQEFLVDKAEADTYINPLTLDYARSSSEQKGQIPENPFMIGQMIGKPTGCEYGP